MSVAKKWANVGYDNMHSILEDTLKNSSDASSSSRADVFLHSTVPGGANFPLTKGTTESTVEVAVVGSIRLGTRV